MVNRTAFTIPGFRAAALPCGMRYSGRPDLTLIATEGNRPCSAAGVFTKNYFCAAPVELCRQRLGGGQAQAVLVNAGIANACTGEEGMRNAIGMAEIAAAALRCGSESVLVASTGVIGMQLRMEPMAECMPRLVAALRPDGWEDAAKAIMTTDLVPKVANTQIELGGRVVTVGGIAKGSGMIAPNMATLLAFACTDADITPEVLDHWTRSGADQSFNCVTVDGDTSTNDTSIVLASGIAGNARIKNIDSPESRKFGAALAAVLRDLAIQIVMDGEGATKLIEVNVSGAASREDARQVAFTIANSPLVKTAFFGEDANWGRIVAAAGRAGVEIDPNKLALYFGHLCVFRGGTPVPGNEIEEQASAVFKRKEISLRIDLGAGESEFTAYTCDFSFDYVKINASYRS